VPSIFQRAARSLRLAFDRPHSSSKVAPRAPPLKEPEALGFTDLAFLVKQNVMREQAKYKCLEFAALQRGAGKKAAILDAQRPSVRFAHTTARRSLSTRESSPN
jgi:hypothetical protein